MTGPGGDDGSVGPPLNPTHRQPPHAKSLTPQPLEEKLLGEELVVQARSIDGPRNDATEHRREEGLGAVGGYTHGVGAVVVIEVERD
ncbi:zinc fyve-like protein [Sesbania bispinosa]|nr:zinc fyve-like protein [Sesbania bispinosa]